MIGLAYVLNDRQLPAAEWNHLLASLPPPLQARLLRYRRWEDRQAGLYGKLLLRAVSATVLGTAADLADLRTDAFERPHLPGLPAFDFSISHTDGLVACCGGSGVGRIGVDVERRVPVALEDFRRVFTAREYALLEDSENPVREFYHLWTRKEAVMKADGRGFSLDPRLIDCLGEPTVIAGQAYTVRSFLLSPDHACHLAVEQMEAVRLRRYRPEEWVAGAGAT